jgi:hypothetical protein
MALWRRPADSIRIEGVCHPLDVQQRAREASKHVEIVRRLEFSASLAQTQIIPLYELITSASTHRPTIRARTVNTREETQQRLRYTTPLKCTHDADGI